MGRRAISAKVKAEAKRPLARKAPKQEAAGTRELEKRLAEALEQQAATAHILSIISSSPTDIQPVLDAVAESAARLCDAADVIVRRVDGGVYRLVAHVGSMRVTPSPPVLAISRRTFMGRAIRERRTIHIHDVLDPHVRGEYPESLSFLRQDPAYRTVLCAPLLREDTAIGVIIMRRPEMRPFSDKQIKLLETFAAQAVIAIENVRLFNESQEALEQQTATADILRVISSSPTDLRPVFDAILEKAMRLCDAHMGNMGLYDGEKYQYVAQRGASAEYARFLSERGPFQPSPDSPLARLIAERQPAQIADRRNSSDHRNRHPAAVAMVELGGVRTFIAVPMLKDGRVVGGISIYRPVVQPFTQKQIDLVSTFASQAVIAIENVRLFNETKDALEQQTVISEILRVISSSPTDVQPVFDAIVKSGVHLFGGMNVSLRLIRGDHTVTAASTLLVADHTGSGFPVPLDDVGTSSSRAIQRREVVQIPDLLAPEEWVGQRAKERGRLRGYRAVMCAPMLQAGKAIGTINVSRTTPGVFTDKQIALLQTFAAQAVIAIENVRLFKELQARNAEVTEALEQQTATADILRVISSSPTDLQPVFDAILEKAIRLCDAHMGHLRLYDEEKFWHVAQRGASAEYAKFLGERGPFRPTLVGNIARMLAERQPIQIEDARDSPEYRAGIPGVVAVVELGGARTHITVPMLKEERVVGGITIYRQEVRPFTQKQIDLVSTFANQAVIAIENVRLFNETKEALEQQTVISEILRVISSSPTDTQPVFDAIVKSGVHLFGGMNVSLRLVKGDQIMTVASTLPVHDTGGTNPVPLGGESDTTSRAILRREVVQVPDTQEPAEWVTERTKQRAKDRGWRAIMNAPMLRENRAIGTIAVTRATPGPFPEKQIALAKTFADQAVIAIENVRLFKELEARNREVTESLEQQTATAEILRVISSSPTNIQPVLDAVAESAARLCAAPDCVIRLLDGETHRAVAHYGPIVPSGPSVFSRGIVVGRALRERRTIQVQDAHQEIPGGRFGPPGVRTILAVPLLREREPIGAIVLRRTEVCPFNDQHIKLLETFADQAVIAIENVRLFNEIQDKSRQLEVASRHKSQFLANMSHELRTPLNAILGYTELILDGIYGDVSEKVRDVMGRVDKSGRHLLGLINDVLDLSKIEAGQLTLALADYSLTDVVQTVFTSVESLAAEKKLALKAALAPDLPRGRGDDRRLAQVLLNLVGNAIKFTEAGEVRLEARCSDGEFVVAVADTGPGITEADQQRIFEEFQQVDDSATRKKGGTGLGLAIARRIIALHGGRIEVESAPGRGATFTVTLPVRVERQAVPMERLT